MNKRKYTPRQAFHVRKKQVAEELERRAKKVYGISLALPAAGALAGLGLSALSKKYTGRTADLLRYAGIGGYLFGAGTAMGGLSSSITAYKWTDILRRYVNDPASLTPEEKRTALKLIAKIGPQLRKESSEVTPIVATAKIAVLEKKGSEIPRLVKEIASIIKQQKNLHNKGLTEEVHKLFPKLSELQTKLMRELNKLLTSPSSEQAAKYRKLINELSSVPPDDASLAISSLLDVSRQGAGIAAEVMNAAASAGKSIGPQEAEQLATSLYGSAAAGTAASTLHDLITGAQLGGINKRKILKNLLIGLGLSGATLGAATQIDYPKLKESFRGSSKLGKIVMLPAYLPAKAVHEKDPLSGAAVVAAPAISTLLPPTTKAILQRFTQWK